MYVIIAGGGKVGSHLAELLLKEGHQLRIIDHRPEVLEKLKVELPPEVVFAGDGSSPTVLEAAGIRQAKVLAAVTGEDEANLVITSLARFEINVPRVIARVNNPKNEWMFTAEMGVDVLLNQASILAKLIVEEMSLGDMMTLLKLRRGKYSVVEEKIFPGAYAVGKSLKELNLPEHCTISGILRGSEMIPPRGNTTLEAGDEVLALVDADTALKLAKLLGRPGN